MIREKLQAWADYFGAVALALWVATGILYLLKNQPNERLILLAAVGAVFFALYLFFKFGAVRTAVTSRGARYGSNALIISLAFIGIVGFVNYLGIRYTYRYDSTESKSFTLSPLTLQALQGLKESVTVTAFYSSQAGPQGQQEAKDRLAEYKNINPDKFNYKIVDPEAEPQIAYEYNVQYDGTIVFERGKRRENVFQTDEQSFTNAVLKVSQDTQPTIYFTTGHGERSLDDSSNNGYSDLASGLETFNYKASSINLKILTDTLPADTTALVIAGPTAAFDPAEVKIVRDYLNKNGHALLMLDPSYQTGLEGFLKEYGVIARNDLVYDPKAGLFGRAQIPVVTTYKNHPVTQNMTGEASVFPGTRSFTVDATVISYTVTALFSTTELSWGETDFDSVKNQTAKLDEGKDVKGPLDIGYTVEGRGDNPMRLVIFGNSSALANANLQPVTTSTGQQVMFGNGGLFLNAMKWFAGQENLIAIPPKTTKSHQITLTGEQMNFVMYASFLFLPVLILIIGALVWWRRR